MGQDERDETKQMKRKPRFSLDRQHHLPTSDWGREVDDARTAVMAGVWDGTSCPCCGKFVKVYRRKLHSEMAAFLCRLVRRAGAKREWVHIRDVLPGGRVMRKASTDGAYLVHWGLVETKKAKPGENSAGMYRPTWAGAQFAMNQGRAPSHIFLLNNEIVGFTDELVTIKDALGDKFSYAELMSKDGDDQ